MGIFDTALYVGIAIMFNLMAHNITSFTFKDLQYAEKVNKTTIMLFLFGISGYVIGRLILDKKDSRYHNDTVSSGLKIGGIILMLTAVFSNWTNVSNELKILGICGGFAYLVYYAYQKNRTSKKSKVTNKVE